MSETKPKKAAPKKKVAVEEAPAAPKAPERVTFISREPEPTQFHIRDVYAHRNGDGRIVWDFPAEEAALVRKHFHVTSGRVIEVEG